MAVTPLNTLKGWFVTAAKPIQAQFHAWMDSFWHKSENIPLSAVANLTNLLNERKSASQLNSEYLLRPPITGDGIVNTTVALPVSCLVREVIVWAPGGCTLTISWKGDADTNTEVTCPAGERAVVLLNSYFNSDQVISFTGSTAPFNYQINTF